MKDVSTFDIDKLVKAAWDSGKLVDLEGIGYGRIHWGNFREVKMTPSPYYYFLAGLVKEMRIRSVLEIGTHSGGSALAMQQGFDESGGLIVTVDITKESDRYLKQHQNIVKVRGDANKQKIVDQVLNIFDGQSVDMLFIDGDHKFYSALLNYSMYTTLLSPKIVCLDDITLNGEMRRLWGFLSKVAPGRRAVNAAEIVPDIRPGTPGFGCVLINP